MKSNIFVLCGGRSVEHEVSLKSASAILNALNKEKYNVYPIFITKEGKWCNLGLLEKEISNVTELEAISTNSVADSIGNFLITGLKDGEENIIIPALHGLNGEDGTIQGLLELLDLPYVGNEVLSSSVAMDKAVMKELFTQYNIPQVKYIPFVLRDWDQNEEYSYDLVEKEIDYPCYVKPANSGSSVGISRVENRIQLAEAFKEAFLYDLKIVVEKESVAREMQISVIGNDDPRASLPGEFIMERPFFDYNAKYIDGKLIPVVPARLDPEINQKVMDMAVKAFKALNCIGLARVDIFVTDENEIFVNEINTMPGFTAVSMTPVLWKATNGTTYPELIEILIALALERYNRKKEIVKTR